MRVRELQEKDHDALRKMARAAGFEYAEPACGHMELVLVVVDDQDIPVMACGAEKIIQLYLWAGRGLPGAKFSALNLLHSAMGAALRTRGWDEVNAFIPPDIVRQFGRRLERAFGWKKNWPSWFKRI